MAEEKIPVGVHYKVHDDGASANAKGIGSALGHAGKAAGGLRHKLRDLRSEIGLTAPALLGVGFGLGAWVEKAKEANAETARARRAIAATLATVLDWDKGTSAVDRYRRSTTLATDVVEELEKTEARYGTTIDDLGEAYKAIAISAAPLRLSQKQILELTDQSAAAAKLYGVSGADAATRIANALQGRVRPGGDAFNRALVNMLGNTKKLGREKIFENMSKALRDVTGIADEASQGMGDHLRKIRLTVEDIIEGLSKPVFKEISSSLGEAAKSMQALGVSGKPLVDEYAGKLVEAFNVMKEATAFLLKHWKEIAAVWAGMKAMNLGASMAGAIGGAAGAAGGAARGAGALPILGGAAGFLGYALHEKSQQRAGQIERVEEMRGVVSDYRAARKLQQEGDNAGVARVLGMMSRDLQKLGITSQEALIARTSAAGAAGQMLGDDETRRLLGVTAKELNDLTLNLVRLGALGKLSLAPGETPEANKDKELKTTGRQPINIDKVELKMDFGEVDAERVFIRLGDEVERFASRRTQSALIHPDVE